MASPISVTARSGSAQTEALHLLRQAKEVVYTFALVDVAGPITSYSGSLKMDMTHVDYAEMSSPLTLSPGPDGVSEECQTWTTAKVTTLTTASPFPVPTTAYFPRDGRTCESGAFGFLLGDSITSTTVCDRTLGTTFPSGSGAVYLAQQSGACTGYIQGTGQRVFG